MNQTSNIREILSQDVNALLKEFLTKKLEDDYVRSYSGKVVDNDDPDQIGRCKIIVFGIYDDIPTEDLPWAIPDFSYIGSLEGNFIVPPIDAIVKVYFDQGDIYLPRYTSKVVEQGKLPSDRTTDYPDTMVLFTTDDGDKLTVNRKNGNMKFTHRGGTVVSIDGKTGEYNFEHQNGSKITFDVLGNIKIEHALFLEDSGIAVIPTGQGPFCALPFCPYSGAPLQGQRVAPGG